MLQIVIYKKLNFWEEYTPLQTDSPQKTFRLEHVNHDIVSATKLLKTTALIAMPMEERI